MFTTLKNNNGCQRLRTRFLSTSTIIFTGGSICTMHMLIVNLLVFTFDQWIAMCHSCCFLCHSAINNTVKEYYHSLVEKTKEKKNTFCKPKTKAARTNFQSTRMETEKIVCPVCPPLKWNQTGIDQTLEAWPLHADFVGDVVYFAINGESGSPAGKNIFFLNNIPKNTSPMAHDGRRLDYQLLIEIDIKYRYEPQWNLGWMHSAISLESNVDGTQGEASRNLTYVSCRERKMQIWGDIMCSLQVSMWSGSEHSWLAFWT